MSIVVQKFGGTSVATAEKIRAAAQRAVNTKRAGHQVVMVVSARGHKTDELVRLAEEVSAKPSTREMDMLLSTGEQEAVALVAMAIHGLGEKAVSLTGGQIGIVTDSTYSKARIRSISNDRIKGHLNAGEIVVACGFQGIDDDFNITTLGRGGSDTTATALAAALEADECEIYTDVEGVFTTDPRAVSAARKVSEISYDEMLELASLGAGVMHSRSIEFAKKFRVPLRVRPSFNNNAGTLISNRSEDRVVTGLAMAKNEARVTLGDLPDQPGVMKTIFTNMSARKIPIDMVIQNVAVSGKAEVTFTVPEGDLAETLTAAEAAVKELGAGFVRSGTHVSKVSAVGSGMLTHSGVAAQMFKSLSDQKINLEMITTSEIKISVLVDRSRCDDALLAVHRGFQLEQSTAVAPAIGAGQVATARASGPENADRLEAVVSRLASMEDIVVSEVLLDETQARVSVHNIPDVPGSCTRIFTAVANGEVVVDMIVQNVSHSGQAQVSMTVPRTQLEHCLKVLKTCIADWSGATITSEPAIAKLSVAGIGLRTHTGVGERLFRALADAGINIQMINTSEIRMSVVVATNQGPQGYAALKQAFHLE
ncbi:aspartate kinase [Planctomicrobium piriforme]|uniref:aspartate kinase n=1 Tax=Planctomicrobium piriforme TaxID=1576369 RepID=A0A1I3FTM6_9PLAN|nr:aspartate kinase [Planctomicrobium piriforme]SFI14590.1 aspartate kinase [Planctomicrobium piriforme]